MTAQLKARESEKNSQSIQELFTIHMTKKYVSTSYQLMAYGTLWLPMTEIPSQFLTQAMPKVMHTKLKGNYENIYLCVVSTRRGYFLNTK